MELSEQLEDLEKGDRLVFNNRKAVYEVVDTDRHSIAIVDPDGNRTKIAKNLQSGGWNVHEDLWWVAATKTD